MQQEQYIDELINFITASPTPFHTVAASVALLKKNGFQQLREDEIWNERETALPAGNYFVVRSLSSLIAFCWQGAGSNTNTIKPLQMVGAHTDSPSLKVKPIPVKLQQNCLQLGVEVYGGALLAPWFDRELSLAGQVWWLNGLGEEQSTLLDFKQNIAIIPSLAIHLNREANKKEGNGINKQTHLVPVIGLSNDDEELFFDTILKKQLNIDADAEITGHDLFFYDAHPPVRTGLARELITGSRLDNLVSCFAAVQSLISGEADMNNMIILNNHEEVGSVSTCGAQGSFLRDTLEWLVPEREKRLAMVRTSLLISADNAHAVHPNYTDKHDPQHQPRLGQGPVIKHNANQRYATSGSTAARFRMLCKKAQVPVQEFVMRSDMGCGSTMGPLTAAEIGVETVDVGIPSLAMHSIRETAAGIDCWYLYQVLQRFFRG